MKVKVKERVNWPITILLILGLVTVIFPLYLTVVIAFKKPSEMTNSISLYCKRYVCSICNFDDATCEADSTDEN